MLISQTFHAGRYQEILRCVALWVPSSYLVVPDASLGLSTKVNARSMGRTIRRQSGLSWSISGAGSRIRWGLIGHSFTTSNTGIKHFLRSAVDVSRHLSAGSSRCTATYVRLITSLLLFSVTHPRGACITSMKDVKFSSSTTVMPTNQTSSLPSASASNSSVQGAGLVHQHVFARYLY